MSQITLCTVGGASSFQLICSYLSNLPAATPPCNRTLSASPNICLLIRNIRELPPSFPQKVASLLPILHQQATNDPWDFAKFINPCNCLSLFCGLFVVGSKAAGRNSCKSWWKNFSIGGDNVSDKTQMAWLLPFLSGLAYFKPKRPHSLLSQDYKCRSQWIFATLLTQLESAANTWRQFEHNASISSCHRSEDWYFGLFSGFLTFSFKTLNSSIHTNLIGRSELYCDTDIRLVAVDEFRWISRLSLLHWKGSRVLW